MRRAGVIALVTGAVIVVFTAASVTVGVLAVKAMVERAAAEGIEVEGTEVVLLEEGASRWLDASDIRDPSETCRVVGPTGRPVIVDWLGDYSNSPRRQTADLGVFTAPTSGAYRVGCSPTAELVVAPGPDFVTVLVLSVVVTVLLPVMLAGPGVVLLGIVFLLVGRSQARRAAAGTGQM